MLRFFALLGMLVASAPGAAQDGAAGNQRVLLRAKPGNGFVAMAAGRGAIYVWDRNGDVHVSQAGGPFVTHHVILTAEAAVAEGVQGDPDDGATDSNAGGMDEEGEAQAEGGTGADGEIQGVDDMDEGEYRSDATDPFKLTESYGSIGSGVYLEYDHNLQFKEAPGDLFAFPYGTTGEAYLEFTPDSPAFWDPPGFLTTDRPDAVFPSPRLSARWARHRAFTAAPMAWSSGAVTLAVDGHDPLHAIATGAFGRRVTTDGGVTWVEQAEEPEPAPVILLGEDPSDGPPAETTAADAAPPAVLPSPGTAAPVPQGASCDDDGVEAPVAVLAEGARTLTLCVGVLIAGSSAPAATPGADALAQLRRAIQRAPAPAQVLDAALARVQPPLQDGPGLAPFLPRIDVVAGGFLADNGALLDAVFLDSTAAGDASFVRQTAEQVTENSKNAAFDRRALTENAWVGVVLRWDLPSLFAPGTSPPARAARAALQDAVAGQVGAALEARARAVEELVLNTPTTDDALLKAALDLEEADARLLALSGLTFPRIAGAAGRALTRIPSATPVQNAIDGATGHLGIADDTLDRMRGAAAARAALPTVLLGAFWADARLEETTFLDEIGLSEPWVKKRARGTMSGLRARLTWDLPRTLRARDDATAVRVALVRRDVALAAAALWCAQRRAVAQGDALDVEEQTAMLTGLTGGPIIDGKIAGGTP